MLGKTAAYVNCLTRQDVPMVLCGMLVNCQFAQVLHSIFIYKTMSIKKNKYNRAILSTMGNCNGAKDPAWVKLREGQLEWVRITPVKEAGNASPIAIWYNNPNHKAKLFDNSADDEGHKELAPVLPLVLLELGVRINTENFTSQKMCNKLKDFKQDQDNNVMELLRPTKRYFLATAVCR